VNRRRPALATVNQVISHVEFTPAGNAERGLLGFVRFRIAEVLLVDSITLRRTRDGRLTLSFPTRRTARGLSRSVLHPLDQAARDEIERVVLHAVREQAPWLFDSVAELSP